MPLRDDLVNELVNGDFDCSRAEATSAVEQAIGEGNLPDDFDKAVEHIYTTQRYWEK